MKMKLDNISVPKSFKLNRTVTGIVCIIFALIVCFIIIPVYNRQLEDKVDVVKVTSHVEKGQKITKEMVRIEKVGKYNLAETYATNIDQVVGKYATQEFYDGEYIWKAKLKVNPLANDEYLSELDGKKGAISITVQSLAAGLSGKLLSGDIVSVIATNDEETYIPSELKYVKVLACTCLNGEDVNEDSRNESQEDEKSNIADTITFLADKYQAQRLANLEASQKVHIELVYRGSEENCNKFLKQQEKIIKEMMEDKVDEQ